MLRIQISNDQGGWLGGLNRLVEWSSFCKNVLSETHIE